MSCALLAALAMFTACSADDEPKQETAEKIASIRQCVLNSNGEIAFAQSSTAGVYLLPASDKVDASECCEVILNDKWDGKETQYYLDDKNYVCVTPSPKDGVYVGMDFYISSIPHFTLEIATMEYCKSENGTEYPGTGTVYWQCLKCKAKYYDVPPLRCTKCGCKKVDPHFE